MIPAAFAAGPASAAKRAISGVGMGLITASTQAVQGEFNPGEIATSVAAAVFSQMPEA